MRPIRHASLSDPSAGINPRIDLFQDRVRTFDPASNGDETTPGGRRLVYGSYVQHHINWSIVDLIGALRYDGYRLSGGAVKADGQRVSPKVTLGITPIAGIQPYISYAEGYRAPAITETLVNGLHPGGPFANFTFIPNANLRPEVGKTIELGVNLKMSSVLSPGDAFRGKVAVFESRVQDYIEGRLNDPGNDCGVSLNGCGDATFGYANVARARLRGIEAEFAYDAKSWFMSIAAASIRVTISPRDNRWNRWHQTRSSSAQACASLRSGWFFGGRLTLVDKQKRLPATAITTASKAYALVDLYTSYELVKDMRAFAQIDNVGDVRYRRFRDGDDSPGMVAKFGFTARLGM